MTWGAVPALVVVGALGLAPGGAVFQGAVGAGTVPGGAVTGGPQSPDSAEVRKRVEDAQARFERRRVRLLPRSRTWPGGGDCDEVVGRLCLRYGESGDWYPEPEPEHLVEGREALLRELAEARAALPGDGWILGQRVRYLGEAGRWEVALEDARRCGGSPGWWCRALEGFTLHALGRFPEADSAFAAALRTADPEVVEAWRDVEPLLDRDGRRALRREAEAGRGEAARELFWTLSDPLWLAPGNDRRTAHLARRVAARIQSESRTPWGMRWGDDLEELTVRYGWERGWERQPRRDLLARDGVVGHHDPESRAHVPDGDALDDPASAPAEAWGPGRQGTASAYAPAYAPVTLPGDAQVAVFPRGDSAVVVAATRLPDDTTYHGRHDHPTRDSVAAAWRGAPPAAGLFLLPLDVPPDRGSGPGAAPFERRTEGTADAALTLSVPAGDYVVGVEAWRPSLRRAGRVRAGLRIPRRPPDVAALSDLLLLRSPAPEGEPLEEAARRAFRRDWLAAGERFAVAWEVTGLGWRPEGLAYRLSVRDQGGGLLSRAGRWLGLVDAPDPTTLNWQEEGPDRPRPVFRSVALELPGLEPGRYLLRLELFTEGRDPLVRERSLEVRPPGT